jgi:hypothetical protein
MSSAGLWTAFASWSITSKCFSRGGHSCPTQKMILFSSLQSQHRPHSSSHTISATFEVQNQWAFAPSHLPQP